MASTTRRPHSLEKKASPSPEDANFKHERSQKRQQAGGYWKRISPFVFRLFASIVIVTTLFLGQNKESGEGSRLILPYQVDCHGAKTVFESKEEGQFTRTSTDTPFDMSIYPPEKDYWVSRLILQQGCWECPLVKHFTETMKKHERAYLLDIGGNIGLYSLAVAALGRQVFVLEPLKQNYQRFCQSVEKNNFHDRVNLFRVAATRMPTKLQLVLSENNMGGTGTMDLENRDASSLQEGVDFANGIKIDSIRHVFPKNSPVAIKIDVEGGEIDALLGAEKFLRETEILLVQMELTYHTLVDKKDDVDALFKILSGKGLTPWLNDDDLLHPLDSNWTVWHDQYDSIISAGNFDVSWRLPALQTLFSWL
jgi:FkbM family methyltransferase